MIGWLKKKWFSSLVNELENSIELNKDYSIRIDELIVSNKRLINENLSLKVALSNLNSDVGAKNEK